MTDVSSRFPQRLPRTRLYEQVAEQISVWITENGLQAGDRLPPERELAVRLGVSRATLSQALVALEVVGVVAVRHGDGTVLTGVAASGRVTDAIRAHADRLPDVIEARDALETKLAALAAQRRTDANIAAMRVALDAVTKAVDEGRDAVASDFQFHLEIARATQNSHFAELMGTLGSMIIPRARLEAGDSQSDLRQYLRRVNGEHESIYDAIVGQDPDGARAAMRTHLANSRERRRRAQAEAG